MDKNSLIVARAFGMEKEARSNCHVGNRPMSTYMRSKAKKQSEIEKVSVDAHSTAAPVEVAHIDQTKVATLSNALEPLAKVGGHEKQAVDVAGSLNKLKQVLRQVIGPSTAFGGGFGAGIGALSGAVDPEKDKGRLISALRRALAFGGAGALTGAGAGIGGALNPSGLTGTLLGGSLGGTAGVSGMSQLLGGDPFTPKHASAAEQDTKEDDEGDEAKPGTEYLESASDEKPKKAPKKKPEKPSENEVKYTTDGKSAAAPMRATGRALVQILNKLLKGRGYVGEQSQRLLRATEPQSRLRAFLSQVGVPPTTGQQGTANKVLSGIGTGAVGTGVAGAGLGAAALMGGDKEEPEKDSDKTKKKKKKDKGEKKAAAAAAPGPMLNLGTRIATLLQKLFSPEGRIGGSLGTALKNIKRPGMSMTKARRAKFQLPPAPSMKETAGAKQLLERLGMGTVGAGAVGAGGAGLGIASLAGGKKEEKPDEKKPKAKAKAKAKPRAKKKSSFGEFLKHSFSGMGQPAAPLAPGKFGEPLRSGMRPNDRQERFNALAKWSLGQE